jgi:hypothetical protein
MNIKTAGNTHVRGAAHHTCFKDLISRTRFIAVQINKKTNNREDLAPVVKGAKVFNGQKRIV